MIIGHQNQQEFFYNSIKENSLAHAYLFSGPSGVGKLELAFDVIQRLLGSSLPNALDRYYYKNGLIIEEARQLKKNLALSPLNSEYKIVIINNAQNIKKEAANAILKLLEEPSGKAIFFLVTRNSALILPTIRSRCYEIKFNFVSDELIQKHLNTSSINELKIHWSGRPVIAKKLLEDKEYLDTLINCRKNVRKFMDGSLLERFQIIDTYSETDNIMYFLKIATEYARFVNFKNNYAILRQFSELYKGLFTTNLNAQFGFRALAVNL